MIIIMYKGRFGISFWGMYAIANIPVVMRAFLTIFVIIPWSIFNDKIRCSHRTS
eukprot:UN00244